MRFLKKYGYILALSLIILLGFSLRLKGFLINPSFWHDECSLGWNIIHKNYLEMFGVLNFLQIAPPFFMIMAKFFTKLFGVNDLILRIVPLLFGLLSLLLFIFFVNKIFDKKITIVVSSFLFAINQNLVNYSSEFKHYSCDVFFTLLCLYLFYDLLVTKSSLKKCLIYSFIFAISIWFSFVSIFSITAGILTLVFKQIKDKDFEVKKLFLFILPFIFSFLLYVKIYLVATYVGNQDGMTRYWTDGFISHNLSNLASLIILNVGYFFYPARMILFLLIFLIWGVFVFTKKNNFLSCIFILTVLFDMMASFLRIYPFEKRAILFLLPVFIIYVCSFFEYLRPSPKLKYALVGFLFLIIFLKPINYSYNYLVRMKTFSRGYHSREMMAEMYKYLKPSDIIVINKNSDSEYAYYASFYDIKNKIYQEPMYNNTRGVLESLDKNHYYWFFMPHRPSVNLEKALQKKKILFSMVGNTIHGELLYVYID